jgi:hypothetical protein
MWRKLETVIEKGSHRVHATIVVISKNAADVRVRISLIATLSLITALLGAVAYSRATGANFLNSLFHMYAVLYAVPGSTVTMEDTMLATVVVNVVFLIGLLVFAVLLGMIGEEVATQVMNLRSGKGAIRIRGHM